MIKEPIKFEPILKEKIWGGEKLSAILQKQSTKTNIGESWEISSVDNDISIVSSGHYKGIILTTLIKKLKGDLVGKQVYQKFGNEFPLLIKYIDAKTPLSIQLHPNDELAKKRHQSFGKTEMWYVMQADDKANLIVGFKKEVSRKDYKTHLKEKTLTEILNVDLVNEGDVYFIPTGRVHAIGAGVLLAEIQQTSDITYRIYDWDRQDDNGNYRELHTENALDALDFKMQKDYRTDYEIEKNGYAKIVSCPYFTTNILNFVGEKMMNHSDKDSFVIYMCVSGSVNIEYGTKNIMTLNYGETVLIPNSLKIFKIYAEKTTKLLEVYINK
jgi:mannose-6-phosphate isomerase